MSEIKERKKEKKEKTVLCAAHPPKASKVIQNVFQAIGGLHEDKLRETLQLMAPTNVKTVHQTFLLHIESNLIEHPHHRQD